jgi:hypothetical protein
VSNIDTAPRREFNARGDLTELFILTNALAGVYRYINELSNKSSTVLLEDAVAVLVNQLKLYLTGTRTYRAGAGADTDTRDVNNPFIDLVSFNDTVWRHSDAANGLNDVDEAQIPTFASDPSAQIPAKKPVSTIKNAGASLWWSLMRSLWFLFMIFARIKTALGSKYDTEMLGTLNELTTAANKRVGNLAKFGKPTEEKFKRVANDMYTSGVAPTMSLDALNASVDVHSTTGGTLDLSSRLELAVTLTGKSVLFDKMFKDSFKTTAADEKGKPSKTKFDAEYVAARLTRGDGTDVEIVTAAKLDAVVQELRATYGANHFVMKKDSVVSLLDASENWTRLAGAPKGVVNAYNGMREKASADTLTTLFNGAVALLEREDTIRTFVNTAHQTTDPENIPVIVAAAVDPAFEIVRRIRDNRDSIGFIDVAPLNALNDEITAIQSRAHDRLRSAQASKKKQQLNLEETVNVIDSIQSLCEMFSVFVQLHNDIEWGVYRALPSIATEIGALAEEQLQGEGTLSTLSDLFAYRMRVGGGEVDSGETEVRYNRGKANTSDVIYEITQRMQAKKFKGAEIGVVNDLVDQFLERARFLPQTTAPITGGRALRTLQLRPVAPTGDKGLETFEQWRYAAYWSNNAPYSFGHDEVDSIGGTLLTALPYINPLLPMMPRSVRNAPHGRYRDGAPNAAQAAIAKILYKEREFQLALDELRARNVNIPAAALHAALNPLTGNPLGEDVPLAERRYWSSRSHGVLARIAERYVYLTEYSTQQCARWLANGINVPLGGMIVDHARTQTMYSMIGIGGDGPLGTLKRSGFDSLSSFDTNSQHYSFQGMFSLAPIINNPRGFHFMPNVRGGTFHGGNGNRYINDTPEGVIVPLWPNDPLLQADSDLAELRRDIMTNRFYDGHRLGNYSKIPVLQGYNTAVNPDAEIPNDFDLSGNWNAADFAGRISHCVDFVAVCDRPMYPGVFSVVATFPLVKSRVQFNLDSLSFVQRRTINELNHTVHRDTTLVPDPIVGEACTASFDLWGAKTPGCAARFSSQTAVPHTALAVDIY